ncbi:hypothetical protein FRB93_012140 [Tulasnella sp. JGI-2019a]|nr:hypothetical protein FRB93_012140 [Tulasnella sp. JGI-2019a]
MSSADLTSSIETIAKARRALNHTNCENIAPALDKLLKFLNTVKKANIKSHDSQTLIESISRLYQSFLCKIISDGDDIKVQFILEIRDSVLQLSNCITKAVDDSSSERTLIPWRSLNPNGPEIVARGICNAMDHFERLSIAVNVDIKDTKTVIHVVEQDALQMSVEEIVAQCPKFRILLLGKAGTGKSSLANRVFDVQTAQVSEYSPGEAEIDKEITSPDNPRFILHDSRGFEYGEGRNLTTVKDFLRRRRAMAIRDQVHAVWLCIQCPTSNERIIETGDEEFLRGNYGVPVIIVFTKYDMLQAATDRKMLKNSDNNEALAREKAEEEYRKLCISPLKAINGVKVEHAKVSIKDKDSIDGLVKLTGQLVEGAVSTTWGVAQRVSVHQKISASTAVGRKNYWRVLAPGISVSGKPIWQCLDMIHHDIVQVWNFQDPKSLLKSTKMKTLMRVVVSDLYQEPDPNNGMFRGAGAAVGIINAVASLFSTGVPIGPLVIGGVMLLKWIYDIYSQTPDIIRVLMAYIVDLTAILEGLHHLIQPRHDDSAEPQTKPLSDGLIDATVDAYNASANKIQSHTQITDFVGSVPNPFNRDSVLNKVISLLENQRFHPDVGASEALVQR